MADNTIDVEFDLRRALDEAERMALGETPYDYGYLAELIDVTANGKPTFVDPEMLAQIIGTDDDISPYGDLPPK